MMKIKAVAVLLVIAFLLFFASGCSRNVQEDGVNVYFFKTGKADCILITDGTTNIMIDTAEDEDGEKIVGWLGELGISYLDMIVITHFDKDHVGGADTIIGSIDVGEIIRPDYISDAKEAEQYYGVLNLMGKEDTILTEKLIVPVGTGEITLLPPKVITEETDNDNSIAAVLEYAGKNIIFAGDAEEARIAELIDTEEISDCDIIKMPHHGRYKDNLEALLKKTAPELAVITASDKNPPEDETLMLLNDIGCEYVITKDGSYVAHIDGNGLSVSKF